MLWAKFVKLTGIELPAAAPINVLQLETNSCCLSVGQLLVDDRSSRENTSLNKILLRKRSH